MVVPEELVDSAPGAKLVYVALASTDAVTRKDVILETMLAPSTVDDALSELVAKGVVEERETHADLRQTAYLPRERTTE